MFSNEVSCDVRFKLDKDGEQKDISAHKFILMARSPVFFKMFNGPLASASNVDSPISVTDIPYQAFKTMLR